MRPPDQEAATRDQEAATPGRGAEAPGPGAEAPVSEAKAPVPGPKAPGPGAEAPGRDETGHHGWHPIDAIGRDRVRDGDGSSRTYGRGRRRGPPLGEGSRRGLAAGCGRHADPGRFGVRQCSVAPVAAFYLPRRPPAPAAVRVHGRAAAPGGCEPIRPHAPRAYLRGNSMSVRPKRSGTCPDAHRAEGVVPRRARRSGLLLLGAASAAVDDSQVERRSIERFGPGGAAHHDVLQPHAPAALDVDARLNAEGHAGLEGLGIS